VIPGRCRRIMNDVVVYIALGSNLGDRAGNISAAVDRLRCIPGIEVLRVSSLLENPAVGGPEDSPAFLNGVAEIRTNLGAQAVLQCILDVERQMGRVRRARWEPRVLDLDLLLYGDQIICSDQLIVPHPLMHERRFVLQPLAELAADVVHPVLNLSIGKLLENEGFRVQNKEGP
jgi:2-amino-4-hydroxy-6-hydroxymethyldihydropteridine diphosphokinase